ncbi:MAG: hypothetical protein EAZ57_01055 [Cytophagales bacterium]|nr:MAG: hypothetical protein EAZ67_00075 [Cytophagales bacterium]TAF62373.1 MAG: hypothetical protein EAZ57_01055 [Cytophagales bacterium]
MFKKLLWLLVTPAFLCLQSCIELHEEITWRSDGSGTYALFVDLSASKQIIEAHQSVTDSSRSEKDFLVLVDSSFAQAVQELNSMVGVSDAKRIQDRENFISGLVFSFASTQTLNRVLQTMSEVDSTSTQESIFFSYQNKTCTRLNSSYIQNLTQGVFRIHQEDAEQEEEYKNLIFKNASFVSIQKAGKGVKILSADNAKKLDKNSFEWRLSLIEAAQRPNALLGEWRIK